MEYIEDCFKDLERPKFGWKVKVILKEDEPCDLNIENPSLSTCGFNSNPASKKSDSDYLTHFAQNRQTGEGFRSVAPPDCRLVSMKYDIFGLGEARAISDILQSCFT